MPEARRVRLFRDGRGQAIRIPIGFELPGHEVLMHRDGDRLMIEPLRKRGLIVLLKTMKPIDDHFPDIDDPARLRLLCSDDRCISASFRGARSASPEPITAARVRLAAFA